jgi:hypothetical protein
MGLLNDNKSMLPNIKNLQDLNEEEIEKNLHKWKQSNFVANFTQMQTICMQCWWTPIYLDITRLGCYRELS